MALSTFPPRRVAAMVPSGNAKTSASNNAASARLIETDNAGTTRSPTGTRLV